jgi:hypothetical protein
MIFLRREHEGYRLDGLIDAYWRAQGQWSSNDTVYVVSILCRNFNDQNNSNAYQLSNPQPSIRTG